MVRLPYTGLFILGFASGVLSATTVTLYNVVQPMPTDTRFPILSVAASFSASVIGVGADGRTTYAEEVVLTKEVIAEPTTTRTFTSTGHIPQTTTVTIVEDASGVVRVYSFSNDGGSVPVTAIAQSCNFQGTTAGSCVQTLAPAAGRPGTIDASYTGSLTPVYTLIQTASIPGQTQTSGGVTRWNSDIWSISNLVSGAIVLHIAVLLV